ncbi:MAG: ECF RNA polymerase sigma factor SigK [Micrococcales bacterium]|nr:ECF RNA polymerase sigma factor SigK [Micrococcales bacterium]
MLETVTRDSAGAASGGAEDTSAEELLLRVADGDRDAFSDLYDRLSPRVFGLVKRLLRDHSQSEEVTQEVFLELWQTAGRYEARRGTATGWILTMTHRRAVDRIRASQASRDRDLRIGVRDWEPDLDTVAENVEITMENERVKRAMSRLTDLQRQAVVLSYYGGYSHSEVAEMLHIPVGTVKTRLRDGMIRLRDELGVTA